MPFAILNNPKEEYDETASVFSHIEKLKHKWFINPPKVFKLPKDSVFLPLSEKGVNIIQPGFITIGGRANSGKTTLSLQLCFDLLQSNANLELLFVSMDDGEYKVHERVVGQLLQTDIIDNDSVYNMVKNDAKVHSLMSRFRTVTEVRNLSGIDKCIQSIMKNTGKKSSDILLLIDYAQKIHYESSDYDNITAEMHMRFIIDQLSDMQKRYNSLFLILSQLSRSGTSHFNYLNSSNFENVSSACIDIITNVDDKKLSDGVRKIVVKKNKHGGKFPLFNLILYDNMKFSKEEVTITLENDN